MSMVRQELSEWLILAIRLVTLWAADMADVHEPRGFADVEVHLLRHTFVKNSIRKRKKQQGLLNHPTYNSWLSLP